MILFKILFHAPIESEAKILGLRLDSKAVSPRKKLVELKPPMLEVATRGLANEYVLRSEDQDTLVEVFSYNGIPKGAVRYEKERINEAHFEAFYGWPLFLLMRKVYYWRNPNDPPRKGSLESFYHRLASKFRKGV